MKRIKAPLCKRCANILHGELFQVFKIGEIENSQEECPWCERNKADARFVLMKKAEA